MKLILASTSPYRRRFLSEILQDSDWEAIAPSFDEREADAQFDASNARAHAIRLARGKAESISRVFRGRWVLGCDEIIIMDGQMLHKPGSTWNAIHQLESMSGKSLQVITGVWLSMMPHHHDLPFSFSDSVEDWIQIRDLNLDQITSYVTEAQPLDCVGSFVLSHPRTSELFSWSHVQDPTNLQGFPVQLIRAKLADLGFKVR